MSDSEASHAALPRNFYDKPDVSSDDGDDESLAAAGGGSSRQSRPQRRPLAARPSPAATGGGQLDSLLNTLRSSCCFPIGSNAAATTTPLDNGESVTYTNPLVAAGSFMDDDEDSATSTSSEELGVNDRVAGRKMQVQTLAKECNVDYTTLPNVANLERLAQWRVELPLVWCFENAFLDLTPEQKAYAALQWIRGETSGSRMTEKALKQLVTEARRVSKVRGVEKILETDPRFATLTFGGGVGVSNLDGVGGEVRRLTELYNDGSLYLIIQRGRVIAVSSSVKGEMWQNKVFDVGLTQTRGPSIYSFGRADDAEALLMALFTLDKSATRGDFTVSRVINPSVAETLAAQPPSSQASAEAVLQPEVLAAEEAFEGDPEMEDFQRVYGAMNHAVDPDRQAAEDEVQFAVDPAARLVVHQKRAPKK